MAKLAIFIDGGYLSKLAEHEFGVWVDYEKFSEEVRAAIAAKTLEPLDLLRAYYYDALPYQSNPPTEDEMRRFSQRHRFFEAVKRLPRYAVREGWVMYRGNNGRGEPIFQQKQVDLLLGLDFALLAGKHQITHACVVSGDSDLLPAFEIAQREGILVWLVHGPRVSRHDGSSTFAEDLWETADDRLLLDDAFMARVARSDR